MASTRLFYDNRVQSNSNEFRSNIDLVEDNLRQQEQTHWCEVENRGAIYSVLDSSSIKSTNSNEITVENVIVPKKKTATTRQRLPPNCARKPSIPPNYRQKLQQLQQQQQQQQQVHEPIYSVVNKPRPIVSIVGIEEQELIGRREELENWLRAASSQRGAMFAENGDDSGWGRECNVISTPRGIVGLVEPYRIQRYPKEEGRREYILAEEELVEEIVDSVSEAGSHERTLIRMQQNERSNWQNINEQQNSMMINEENDDDTATLVPNDFPDNDIEKMRMNNEKSENNQRDRKMSSDKMEVVAVKYGKEERAVDVPDGSLSISAATTFVASNNPTIDKTKVVNNEQHDKDSLNETGSTTAGTADGGPNGAAAGPSSSSAREGRSGGNGAPLGKDNGGDSNQSPERDQLPTRSRSPLPKSLVSRILARSRTPDDLLDHSEPFSQLWIVLSNVYGQLVIIVTIAICLAEVMDTPVQLLSLQGIFLIYMYVGSIVVIIGIYMWVLVDSCGSLRSGRGLQDAELGAASLTRFGSLKRAHISRSKIAPTSFYIRVGALVFGLAALVFNGLEMAMHYMMQGAECLNDIIFVHPILHGLFTFLMMHFLFVRSQVLVERFGLAARFCFTHLAATNIAVWARLIIWDSAQEWTYFVYLAQRGPLSVSSPLKLRGFPNSITQQTREIPIDDLSYEQDVIINRYVPISQEQISQVVALQECFNTNSLGQFWTSSVPILYPFIVQFSLIAAAVTYVMGQNVGRSSRLLYKKFHSMKDLPGSGRMGCNGSSKGLFLGILCTVAGIVVILIFLVVREDNNFPAVTLTWLTCGTLSTILGLSGLMTASGLFQVRQMSIVTRSPAILDTLLSNVALCGVQLYSVFTIVACACSLYTIENSETELSKDLENMRDRHILLLVTSVLQLIQSYAQSTLIAEASQRCCITRFQIITKPGRQIITFLLFSNVVLWAFDTVVTQHWISQELQLRFYGILAWGVISRIGLPLLIFYRFHSFVLLFEAWGKCYRTLKSDHPLN